MRVAPGDAVQGQVAHAHVIHQQRSWWPPQRLLARMAVQCAYEFQVGAMRACRGRCTFSELTAVPKAPKVSILVVSCHTAADS